MIFGAKIENLKKTENQNLYIFAISSVLIVMYVLFVLVSIKSRFVMDEFNMFQCIRDFSTDLLYKNFDPIKTVLGTQIFKIAMIARDPVNIVLNGRLLGLCSATLSMIIIFYIGKKLWPKSNYTSLIIVFVLSYSNFFERAFRIRTDTVALTFALASFWFMVRRKNMKFNIFNSGALAGLSFLCTQKSIYFFIAYFIALFVSSWSIKGWRDAFFNIIYFTSGWSVVLFLYSIYYGGFRWWNVVQMVFLGPKSVIDGTSVFSGLELFVRDSIVENFILYGISLIGICFVFFRWRSSDFCIRFAVLATSILVILIFNHNQPWPYVFVWPQAFLSFFIIPFVEFVVEKNKISYNKAILVVIALFCISIPRQINYLNHSNDRQISIIREANALLEPEDRYFDGIGMIPSRDIAGYYPDWWWDTPTIVRIQNELRLGKIMTLEKILNDQPKLFILNYRFFNAINLLNGMTINGYVRVSENIILSGIEINKKTNETKFICRWGGQYQLFDENGTVVEENVIIDGNKSENVINISPGVHIIRIENVKNGRFLFPKGTKINKTLPISTPVPDLFSEVYTY